MPCGSTRSRTKGETFTTYVLWNIVETMTGYEAELQRLKPYDEVQYTSQFPHDNGYSFITTAGHGYLVVPVQDTYALIARQLCKYGFIGELAYYLEEDSEAPAFLRKIKE